MPATLDYSNSVFFQGPNPHALMLEFPATGTIAKGAPVTLDPTDGSAIPADATTVLDAIVGYALNSAVDGQKVTVIAKGQFVVRGVAGAAGLVPLDLVGFTSFTDPDLVFTVQATANLQIGLALSTAAAGEEVYVLIR